MSAVHLVDFMCNWTNFISTTVIANMIPLCLHSSKAGVAMVSLQMYFLVRCCHGSVRGCKLEWLNLRYFTTECHPDGEVPISRVPNCIQEGGRLPPRIPEK